MWRGNQFFLKLRNFFRRDRAEREMTREMESHLELIADDFRRRGMTPEEAQAAARRAFGNIELARESHREARSFSWLEELQRDCAYAVRTLRKSPGFTLAAILILGVGIGANTAVFSQVNAVFFKTLPVHHPHDLRTLSWTSPERAFARGMFQGPSWQARLAAGETIPTFSYSVYLRMRDGVTRFSDLACFASLPAGAMTAAGPVFIELVSGNYFQTIGAAALIGRTINIDDDRPDGPPVAVISYGLWRRAFASDPDILDRTIRIRETPFAIIGVMPQEFGGLNPAVQRDVMLPYANRRLVTPAGLDRNFWGGCQIVGRLQTGAPDEQARAEAEALLRSAILDDPPNQPYEMPKLHLADAAWGSDDLRRTTSSPLAVLMAAVSIILLITCANLAALLLARGRARQKEIATRLAIGAARSRIVRQLLAESLLLAIMGGFLAVGLAYGLSPLLTGVLGQLSQNLTLSGQPRPPGVYVTPDFRVLAFSVGLTLLTGLMFGLLPALRAARIDLLSIMKQTPAASPLGRFRFRSGKTLISVQVALSVLLLMAAGLFARTLVNLMAVPVGYNPQQLVLIPVANGARSPRQVIEDTMTRLEGIPGVISASASEFPLFNNAEPKRPVCIPAFGADVQRVDWAYVFPRFFEVWGVPLLLGKDFNQSPAAAVIVNETFVKRFLAGKSPLGQTVGIGDCTGGRQASIIGVTSDHVDRQRAAQTPIVYAPYPLGGALPTTTFAVRTASDPHSVVPAVRRLIVEAGVTVEGDVTIGAEYWARTMRRERFLTGLLVFFGFLALLICCLGIYGLLAYVVNSRTFEIGVRIALGAERKHVASLVVRETLAPVAAGIASGMVATLTLLRYVESILFGISPHDPWTAAGTAAAFLSVAGLAAFLPASHASRIDPMRSLRHE